jgi:hypothetical protein
MVRRTVAVSGLLASALVVASSEAAMAGQDKPAAVPDP